MAVCVQARGSGWSGGGGGRLWWWWWWTGGGGGDPTTFNSNHGMGVMRVSAPPLIKQKGSMDSWVWPPTPYPPNFPPPTPFSNLWGLIQNLRHRVK